MNNKNFEEIYTKDINQLRSSFDCEKKKYEAKIVELNNELFNIYNSKAWKLITKYREFIASIRPKENIEKKVKENNIIYPKIHKDKPLIAYVIPGCQMSGGIAVVLQHLNRLKKRGYDVLLITEDQYRKIDWFPNQEVEIVGVKEAPTNIDILVATGYSTAYTLQKLNAKRKFYFVQSDETRFFPKDPVKTKAAKESYSMDYEYITEAKWIRKWLKDNFDKDAQYVPNGIDEEIIYPTFERNIANRRKRILLEGAIDIPYKGMQDAFKAVEGLDCEVWCVSYLGKPDSSWHCDKFFESVPMQMMKFLYSNCDILLKMSRVEGFFGPPMEMMACKGTCVVSKVSGYDEYIIDGYNALVVEQGDIKGAHDALNKLLKDDKLRKKLSENGYKTAMDWKWDNSIDLLEKIYNEKQ